MQLGTEIRCVNVSSLSLSVGMSRANWYKMRRRRQRLEIDEDLVLSLVKEQRRQHPRMGCRKLHQVLELPLREAGVSIGRDRLFELLRVNDLLVPPAPRSCRTTDSRHCLPLFGNLVRDLEPTGPNQIWVSDITYVRTESSFVYLALIMDRYSRKIVGYHCGDSLEALGCIAALKRALTELPEGSHPIHHSDRGCQYCSHDYVNHLKQHGLRVSMTEIDHCAENAHAERINGTLKIEYGLAATFRDAEQARRAVDQAIWLYNHRRPHANLQMRYPAEVHKNAA
jgi:putative transposase